MKRLKTRKSADSGAGALDSSVERELLFFLFFPSSADYLRLDIGIQ